MMVEFASPRFHVTAKPSPEPRPYDQRQIPSMETTGPVVYEVIDIAQRELNAPRSVEIETLENREFLVRIIHWSAPGANTR